MSQNTVFIEGYQIEASIGVFEWEKEISQNLRFDLQLQCDFTAASTSDNIEDTVDYGAVCQSIDEVVNSQHFNLLEYLAESVATTLFSLFAVQQLTLRISKPGAVSGAMSVGVQIERSREG